MLPKLTLSYWLTLHGLVTVVAVLAYVVAAHVRQQRRQPAAAIAWILFILLLPYVALPAFLTFGSRKRERPPSKLAPGPSVPHRGSDRWAVETIEALAQPAPASYHALNLHEDGSAARDALLATIEQAQRSIDLSTFILSNDDFGRNIVDRLTQKAQAGVRVRVLLDGLGRFMGGRPSMRAFVRASGDFALFVPPLSSPLKGRTNLRNHRKLVVADAGHPEARLWCGGRNIAAEYFNGSQRKAAWRDLTIDLRGPLVEQAAALFEHDWQFAHGKSDKTRRAEPSASAPLDGAQMIASGPDQVDDTIYSLLVTAAYRARRHIALTTPYFVPESALLMALCLAARRGLTVDLLLPARSNHRLSDFARGRALRALAQAGGRIWLAPGMLHAKLVVIDDTLALAGSANLDSRSLFLNYEVMIAFHKAGDIERFAHWFEHNRASARPYVAHAPGLARDVAEGMLLWLGFQL